MLGYTAAEVMNKITPADISDPQEVIARAAALSLELGTPITPGFEALVFKASRGIEDIYELTYMPQGRQPVSRGGVGHGAARRARRHHRLPVDWHRQHRAQAGGRGAAAQRNAGQRRADGGKHRARDQQSARGHHEHTVYLPERPPTFPSRPASIWISQTGS
jgi:hypothetical protein